MSPSDTYENNATQPAAVSDTANSYTMPTKDELKEFRRNELKQQVEQEVQKLIGEAAPLKQKISESKTQAKKQYYEKKFKKISKDIIQLVTALQMFEAASPSTHSAPVEEVAA